MPFVHILNELVYFVICFVFVAEVLEFLCVKDISPLSDICFQIHPASFKLAFSFSSQSFPQGIFFKF